MRRFAILLVLGACGGGTATAPAPAAPTPEPAHKVVMSHDQVIKIMLERLGKAADCEHSRKKVWCAAVLGWDTAEAAELPAADHVLIGVSVGLRMDQDVDDLLASPASLSALALGAGGKALITDLTAHNAAEQRVIALAMGEIAKAIKGEIEQARIAQPIVDYAHTLPPSATYPLARSQEAGAWIMTGKAEARLRKAGNVWIAVEIPADGPPGIFVSIYTDRYAGG